MSDDGMLQSVSGRNLENRRPFEIFEGISFPNQMEETRLHTREETHMEPENGPVEEYSPLQPSGFQVPC